MSIELYMGFVAASILLVLFPGPNVTIIVANSLAHGTRSGLMTVAGTGAGIAVLMTALLPQLIDPAEHVFVQMVLLGVTFLVIEIMGDSVYALLAGRARLWISQSRQRLIDRISGVLLIGGGMWLAMIRR